MWKFSKANKGGIIPKRKGTKQYIKNNNSHFIKRWKGKEREGSNFTFVNSINNPKEKILLPPLTDKESEAQTGEVTSPKIKTW